MEGKNVLPLRDAASPPQRLHEEFDVTELLDHGGFSSVVLATERSTNSAWALKLIECPTVKQQQQGLQEAQHHARLSAEPSIVPLASAFSSVCKDTQTGQEVHLVVLVMPVLADNALVWLTRRVKEQVRGYCCFHRCASKGLCCCTPMWHLPMISTNIKYYSLNSWTIMSYSSES